MTAYPVKEQKAAVFPYGVIKGNVDEVAVTLAIGISMAYVALALGLIAVMAFGNMADLFATRILQKNESRKKDGRV